MLAERGVHRLGIIYKHLAVAEVAKKSLSSQRIESNLCSGSDLGMTSGHNEVYIVAAARTPFGAFQGGLSHLSAPELGAIAMRAAIERSDIPPEAIDEVFMGNVCQANIGQAPARQAAIKAGIPLFVDCTTINKVCSSGMKSISLAAQSIQSGHNNIVIAGGMESMSNVPHYATNVRKGQRLGDVTLVDGLLRDGLTDALDGTSMGGCAELCAEQHNISRTDQDTHAIESFKRAQQATHSGVLSWEITPVESKHSISTSNAVKKQQQRHHVESILQDEAISKMNADKLRNLRPYFRPREGTVTAGNSSSLSDGAAVVILASKSAVQKYNLLVLGRIVGFADAAKDPKMFPTAPALAIQKALDRCGMNKEDIDYWEINEAFSVVDIVNQRLLHLQPEKVNVHGGAVAIGHPIGASGARLIIALLNVLRVKDGAVGVAAICNGGGGATAMVIERVQNI